MIDFEFMISNANNNNKIKMGHKKNYLYFGSFIIGISIEGNYDIKIF